MSSVTSAPAFVDPFHDDTLVDDVQSQYVDREGTIEPDDDGYSSDDASSPEVIELLSDTETSVDDDEFTITDIKPTLLPSPSTSTAYLGTEDLKPALYPTPSTSTSYLGAADLKPALHPAQYTEQKPAVSSRKGKPQVRLTHAQETEIVALSDAGWSQQRIAERLGRPHQTVGGFLRRRRMKLDAYLSTLPGSAPQRAPQRRRPPQHRQQRQLRQGTTAPQQMHGAAQFVFKHDPEGDVKMGGGWKKEEPL
ncbi:hypothetical protein sr11435 [Sporisorium reilianum SRZ2]|uniref:Uncharacterized protein n=1 Tax=Sporisorium reilianum (strain SRZ2) TaxID=999809 RepID=E6ZJI1_SPORE|nr:hypothetical protein sr11435 [Sporisorium reilianum SRZ2]